MSKYTETVEGILRALGGEKNVSAAYHCMTRLRVNLVERGKVDDTALKAVKGVVGINDAEGELQVIIGPAVERVYAEFVAMADLTGQRPVAENLDAGLKKENVFVRVGNGILNAFSASVSPILPLLIITGVFNLTAILLGPTFLNVLSTESRLYSNLTFVSQSILYFLPMFIAYTASRHFGCNSLITMAICGFMLFPDYLAVVAAKEGYTFFGIPVALNNYSSSILPFILIPFVQQYVEKLVKKIIPDILKVVLVPSLIFAVMMPLSLCLLAPVSAWFGKALNAALLWLYGVAGPLETTVVGAIAILGVAFGFLRPVYFTGLMAFLSTGVDYTVLPMLAVICNFVASGATLGYMVLEKDTEKKQLGATCLLSCLLGGVSEPAIYGIFMREKRVLLSTIVGGAVAGLVQGILKVGYFQRGTSNIFGVLSFVAEGNSANFVNALITCGIGFVVTMLLVIFSYQKEREPKV